jgi:hypothetical protein
MDVDAVLGPMSRENSPTGPVPFVISEAEYRAGTVAPSDEGIACTKAICNYVLDKSDAYDGGHILWFCNRMAECVHVDGVAVAEDHRRRGPVRLLQRPR